MVKNMGEAEKEPSLAFTLHLSPDEINLESIFKIKI